MSNSLCKSSVYKTYQEIIKDVITNVREHFLEDGVDEQVLQELKQLWEAKLKATKAVDESKEVDKIINDLHNRQAPRQDHTNSNEYQRHQLAVHQQQLRQVVGQVPPNNHMPLHPPPHWRRLPIQLTLPTVPGTCEGQRVLAIEVPEIFLQGSFLKSILTGQIISTTMGLPLSAATAFLQEHVNNAFIKHQQALAMGINPNLTNGSVIQSDGANDDSDSSFDMSITQQRLVGLPQGDAPMDTSDEDDIDVESDDNDDDKEEEEVEEDGVGPEEEPLNSGDDVSDTDDVNDSFETENVVVCQFDKISRCRNRWKFHLKDGIMNLNGEDYVFQKANGDAEW